LTRVIRALCAYQRRMARLRPAESVQNHPLGKKAVNWALRNIGKRNQALNVAAIAGGRSSKS
jgi:hypothetical protein